MTNKKENFTVKFKPKFAVINKPATEWIEVIESREVKKANSLYKNFSAKFPKQFITSM